METESDLHSYKHSLFLCHAKTHQEGGHLPARKRILTRNWISQCPDLELFRHQNCENQFLLCKPLSLWYLLWQFKWRKCLSTPSNHLSFIALYHHLDFVYIFVICVLFGSPHQNTCSMEKNFVCYKCCCTKNYWEIPVKNFEWNSKKGFLASMKVERALLLHQLKASHLTCLYQQREQTFSKCSTDEMLPGQHLT